MTWSFSSKAYNCTPLIDLQFFINLPEDYQLNLLWHRCLWLQTTVLKKKGSDDHNPEESVTRPAHNFNSGTVSRQVSPLSVDHINNSRHLSYHLCINFAPQSASLHPISNASPVYMTDCFLYNQAKYHNSISQIKTPMYKKIPRQILLRILLGKMSPVIAKIISFQYTMVINATLDLGSEIPFLSKNEDKIVFLTLRL